MSCRAMGRQVEFAVFDHLLSELGPSLGFLPVRDSSVMKLALSDLDESRTPTVVRIETSPTP